MYNYFSSLVNGIVSGAGNILIAILLLVLAFIVSAIVRSLVVKLLNKTKLRQMEATANGAGQQQYQQPGPNGYPQPGPVREGLVDYIGKLVYLLVFLLFVPSIFSRLGVTTVSAPISNLLQTIWGYVPNVLAAVIILVVGNLIAKLVRQLLIPLFQKINIDKLQEKAGIEVSNSARLSETLAYIVYVLILIPVIIVALHALNISAVSNPAISMLNTVFGFIPNILVAIILIWIGTLIGKFAGSIVKQLIASTGVDVKIKELVGEKAANFEFSKTIGLIVQVVLDIFFIVEGISVLKLAVLTDIGTTIIAYLPSVLASVLIIIAAFFVASAAEKALEKNGLKDYAIVAKAAIFVVAGFMVLNQLGIAGTIVNTAFILIVAALAVAFAVAFGVGGREFAHNVLDDLLKKLKKKD